MDKESKLEALEKGRKELEIDIAEFEQSNKHAINPVLPEGYDRTFHFLNCKRIIFEYDNETILTKVNETATFVIPAEVGFRVIDGKCRSKW
ncbi:hypothetical protein FocnCong_v009586 [Fusarium oxysporum f. sp. conglutinans]|nr:hypothetical protein FocnCong_v009586 [Fusarium oxysporum f. sp. conglutinans]